MKNFNDLLALGRTEPTVYNYLKLLEKGDLTKEEALVGMVMTLVDQKREVTDKYIKHIQNCTTPTIKRGGLVNPDGGDYPLKWMSERGFKDSDTTE